MQKKFEARKKQNCRAKIKTIESQCVQLSTVRKRLKLKVRGWNARAQQELSNKPIQSDFFIQKIRFASYLFTVTHIC